MLMTEDGIECAAASALLFLLSRIEKRRTDLPSRNSFRIPRDIDDPPFPSLTSTLYPLPLPPNTIALPSSIS